MSNVHTLWAQSSYQTIFATLKYSHVVLVAEIHLFAYQQSIDDIHRENGHSTC